MIEAIGDLGGVMDIIKAILALIVVPISNYSFLLDTINRLYYTKKNLSKEHVMAVKFQNFPFDQNHLGNSVPKKKIAFGTCQKIYKYLWKGLCCVNIFKSKQ